MRFTTMIAFTLVMIALGAFAHNISAFPLA